MDQLLCPLCGRRVSLRYFNPESFDSDIYAVSVVGLGRGRGFEEVDRYSVLDKPYLTGLIARRCETILELITGSRPRAEENREQAKLLQSWIDYARRLEGDVKNLRTWVDYAHGLEDKVRGLEGLNAAYRWAIRDMQSKGSSPTHAGTRVNGNCDAENLCRAENEDILRKINSSANTDFDDLGEATDFLLEG